MDVQRDRFIDSLKGLAILLMIIGHSGCPNGFHDYIYLFHMPLFFFISGYLFKTAYVKYPFQFVWRRVRSCYIPFVKYGLLFLLMHELLVPLGFSESYAVGDYLHRLFMILSFSGTEVFLGPYWFLIEMFFASTLFIAFWYLLDRGVKVVWGKNEEKETIVVGGIVLLSMVCISCFSLLDIHIPKISIRTFLAIAYLAVGYAWKLTRQAVKLPVAVLLLVALGLVVLFSPFQIGSSQDGGMNVESLQGVVLYFPISLLGIIGVWGLVGAVVGRWRFLCLECWGSSSMGFLTWHLLSGAIVLRVMDLLQIEDLPPYKYPIETTKQWFVIALFTMAVSLLIVSVEGLLEKMMEKRHEP